MLVIMQRDTVKNERAQRYDNRPYGLIWEKMAEAIYPEGHPYSWQTIGYVEDLDRVDVNDLKAFFLRWYGPNNAVLTIGGDIDTDQTLEWVNKYFGSIPRGPEVSRRWCLPRLCGTGLYFLRVRDGGLRRQGRFGQLISRADADLR